jgi:hypothetical protein
LDGEQNPVYDYNLVMFFTGESQRESQREPERAKERDPESERESELQKRASYWQAAAASVSIRAC